jgi:hypothetical protein
MDSPEIVYSLGSPNFAARRANSFVALSECRSSVKLKSSATTGGASSGSFTTDRSIRESIAPRLSARERLAAAALLPPRAPAHASGAGIGRRRGLRHQRPARLQETVTGIEAPVGRAAGVMRRR